MRQSTDYQSRESGGVLGFIIISLVLIGLLAGGLWFIKNRYDVAAKVDTVSQAAKDSTQKATDKAKKDQPTTSNPSSNAGSTTGGSNSTPAPAKPAENKPSQPAGGSQQSAPAPAPAASQPTTVATTGPSHIASTGPTDGIMNLFLLAGLLVVGFLYRQSRHNVA